jgi:hypothetical protein
VGSSNLGESTDITNKLQLLAYLRTGTSMNGSIQNQFLFCSELKKNIESQEESNENIVSVSVPMALF